MVREVWVDVATALSCVSVVFLHTNFIFWKYPCNDAWFSSNLIESIFYFAVPVFFMISGYTLFGFSERYDLGRFGLRRFMRTGIPFFAWSIFWYLLNLIPSRGSIDLIQLPIQSFNVTIQHVYWFFPCLFSVYVGIAIFEGIKDKRCVFPIAVLAGFFSFSILPFLESLMKMQLNHAWQVGAVGGYMIFPLLGYIIGHSALSRTSKGLMYLAGVLSLAASSYATWRLSSPEIGINMLFKGYINWPSVLYSSALFLFIKNCDWSMCFRIKFFSRCIMEIKECSLGIYLIHPLVLLFLHHCLRGCWPDYGVALSFRLLAPVVIVIISIITTKIICLVPGGRYLVGK